MQRWLPTPSSHCSAESAAGTGSWMRNPFLGSDCAITDSSGHSVEHLLTGGYAMCGQAEGRNCRPAGSCRKAGLRSHSWKYRWAIGRKIVLLLPVAPFELREGTQGRCKSVFQYRSRGDLSGGRASRRMKRRETENADARTRRGQFLGLGKSTRRWLIFIR